MKARILVIDDEESIRFTFAAFLSKEGYEVVTAADYPDAVALLERETPDLIFADIILGRHVGTEVLAEVKRRGLKCPVVMITGLPAVETAAESVRQGAYDYLAKPIGKETLLRVTKIALEHKRLADEKDRMENEKEGYRRHLETVFRSINEAIITVDNDLRVVNANQATERVCGLNREMITGRNFGELQAHCLGSCVKVLRNTLERCKSIREYRMDCGHHDRPEQVVVINASPLLDQEGASLGAVLTIRDITRLNELERELKERHQFHHIIGKSKRMREIFTLLEDLAPTDTTVLISGESGTGKEVVAKALHHAGPRTFRSLISVNCSALAEGLLESELFGHVKGAFTGAIADKKGRFQMADGGTIFLDEVGDISPVIQLKLLRVLQEKTFERVGDSSPLRVDVRVIAATNRDLREKVRSGQFREDLYYRLKVLEIILPPLRERTEDIPLLVNHFSGHFNRKFNKNIQGVHDDVMESFMRYPWPGNVRELEHAIEHAFVLCRQGIIMPGHIPAEIMEYSINKGVVPSLVEHRREPPAIENALERSGWNKAKAARILGVSRQTLYRKMVEYKIGPPHAS
jgi:two-component system, NtrC family, response regulator HydG